MELLALFDSKSVRFTRRRKIIRAKEFSTLMEANTLLEEAKKQALEYRKEVALECEKLKEQATHDGFDIGLKKWNKQLASLEKQLEIIRQDMESAIVSLAMTAAKKIIGRELELAPQTVVDVVSTALKPVTQHKKIKIYVHRDDLDYLEKERPRIKKLFENLQSLSILVRDDVSRGGCIIETEAGIINAKLEKQWEALEEAFKGLIKSK